MMVKLTKKEKGFAEDYLDTGNGTQSVLENYDVKNENVAGVLAHRLLRKVKIQEYLEDKAEVASIRVVELSNQSDNLPVALGATKDILDRAGFKPVEKSQSVNVNIEVEATDEIKNLANQLNELHKS